MTKSVSQIKIANKNKCGRSKRNFKKNRKVTVNQLVMKNKNMKKNLRKTETEKKIVDEDFLSDEALPFDMIDDEFKHIDTLRPCDMNFALPQSSDEENEPEEFSPRSFECGHKRVRFKLPIKTDNGIISQIDDKDNVDHDFCDTEKNEICDSEMPNAPSTNPGVTLKSPVEFFSHAHKKLEEMKEQIGVICCSVTENPEKEVYKLKKLRLMLIQKELPCLRLAKQKLIFVSLTELFKSVAPSYRIRPLTETEKAAKVKKETKALRNFEEIIVSEYHNFLKLLEATCKKNIHSKEVKLKNHGLLVLKCMCSLLANLIHFNYRANIFQFVIPYMFSEDEEVASVVCDCIKSIFDDDVEMDVSLEAVRFITKYIKQAGFAVSSKALDVFLNLNIKEVTKDNPEKPLPYAKRFKALSRRDRKKLKEKQKLTKELEEETIAQRYETKLKKNTEIMEQIFLCYFKILRFHKTSSDLLSTVLRGLSNFAHLINVEFFDDLINILHDLIKSQHLTSSDVFHSLITVFTVMSSQCSVINIDLCRFYECLYERLLSLSSECLSFDEAKLLIRCIEVMLLKRTKEVHATRMLAFIKRLSTIALNCTNEIIAASLLLSASRCLQTLQTTASLFNSESAGLFLPEVEHPDFSCANHAVLWDTVLFNQSYSQDIRDLSQFMLKGTKVFGPDAIPERLNYASVIDFLTSKCDHYDYFKKLPETIPKRKNRHRIKDEHLIHLSKKIGNSKEITDFLKNADFTLFKLC